MAPEVVYSPIVPARVRDKDVRPGHRDADGQLSPEMSEALTVAPEVVYSPIVPVPLVRDKDIRPRYRDAVGRLAPR